MATDTVAPAHTFETYRHGYGYEQLRAGLLGPAQMAAVGDWWLANHRSLTYAAHRILIAVDTGTTLDRLAADLQLDRADLDRPGQYGQALHTLLARNLLIIDAAGRYTPTPDVDPLLRPDDRAHASRRLRWFTDLLQACQPPVRDATAVADHAAPAIARAFPELHAPDPARLAPTAATPPAASADEASARRRRTC